MRAGDDEDRPIGDYEEDPEYGDDIAYQTRPRTADQLAQSLGRTCPEALEAIERVAPDRRVKTYILHYLLVLRDARQFGSLSPEQFQDAKSKIFAAAFAVLELQCSDLRYHALLDRLHPDDPAPYQSLGIQLFELGSLLRRIRNRGKRHPYLFERVLAALLRLVRWSTGTWRDEEMELILPAVLGEDRSLVSWRENHKHLLRPGRLERRWDERVRLGQLPAPLSIRRRSPSHRVENRPRRRKE